jgi:predicted AlkP superfamily phosphohydrolase/phosphomutase
MSPRPRVFVLGLDGASWRFLDPWIAEGRLPGLARLRATGCWGPLDSVRPPVTCPAWKCYSAGKNPGQVGAYWWLDLDKRTGRVLPPHAGRLHGADLWDYLGDEGRRVAVVNVPATYPPRPLNGLSVAGPGLWPDSSEGPYTHPASLQERLERDYGYRVDWAHGRRDPRLHKEENVADVADITERQLRFVRDVLRRDEPDFFHFTVFYVVMLQHLYGSDPVQLKVWRLIDDFVSERLAERPDDYFVTLSDHGLEPVRASLDLGNHFHGKGWIARRWTAGAAARGLRDRLLGPADEPDGYRRWFAVQRWFRARLPPELSRALRPVWMGTAPVLADDFEYMVRWHRSRLLPFPQGPLYVNDDHLRRAGVDPQRFRAEVSRELLDLRDPVTGERPVEAVHRREDLYAGAFAPLAPDLLVEPCGGYEIHSALGGPDYWRGSPAGWHSGNVPEGMWAAAGPGLRAGARMDGARLIDVAPTLLWLMGAAVPSDMDGRVLADAVRPEARPPAPRRRDPLPDPARGGGTPPDGGPVMEQLRQLGYLG